MDFEKRVFEFNGSTLTVWAPPDWSDRAVGIFATKYMQPGEISIGQTIDRVVDRLPGSSNLKQWIYDQKVSFNSPVWFNLGVRDKPQCSACFINSVEDDLVSIMDLAKTEAMLFKWGSGSGTNFSTLRHRDAPLSGGTGKASGPLSFMEGLDGFAGVIKSGGKTRRSAKMAILDDTHPDIYDFIDAKVKCPDKFQNTNHSVRVTSPLRDNPRLSLAIAEACHACGDPGVQFAIEINKHNPTDQEIVASNPCSEFVFLNNTACNLASINLEKVTVSELHFIVPVMIRAMDKIVDIASYPTKAIEENSHHYRPLGLGFTGLGGHLMRRGVPYDSAEGRLIAHDLMHTIQVLALETSRELGERFDLTKVIEQNESLREALDGMDVKLPLKVNNAQVTAIAPTGTISFIMDATTTGIEPEFALVKTKYLAGGGELKTVNRVLEYWCVRNDKLDVLDYVKQHNTVVGSSMPKELWPVFATANDPQQPISWRAHLDMMATVQPFVSGAISKTINVPNDTSVREIERIFLEAEAMKLKCVAVYRDGCRSDQPLVSSPTTVPVAPVAPIAPARRKLPDTRQSITHKFSIAGHKGYVTVGLYDDGTPGEVFISMNKQGSTLSGMLVSFATAVSMALQYGTPLTALVSKFSHARFEPSGFTGNKELPMASSIVDYIFRWLRIRFVEGGDDVGSETLCLECGGMIQSAGTCGVCLECGSTTGCS